MSEDYGIEKIKTLALLGIDLAKDVKKTFADGKFKVMEAFRFVDNFNDLEDVLPYTKEIEQEFNDLSLEEVAELKALIADELNIEETKAEELVEAGLAIGFGIGKVIQVLKAKDK